MKNGGLDGDGDWRGSAKPGNARSNTEAYLDKT
jgi:hypothetical protein